jgi:hypothetical protein
MGMQTSDEARLPRHLAANGGSVHCARPEVATLAHAQRVGDGRTPEGQDEWPAMLRELSSPV